MKIKLNNTIHTIDIDQAHYMRRLGFPSNYELTEHMEENLKISKEWYIENGEPWVQIFDVGVEINDGKLYFDGKAINSEKIYKRFSKYQVKQVKIILATAGEKSDIRIKELWKEMPDQSYFLDAYTASVTESIINYTVGYIKNSTSKEGKVALSRYSPGYKGWDLSQQKILMDIIINKNNAIPVKLTESALLYPLKSQISVIGIY